MFSFSSCFFFLRFHLCCPIVRMLPIEPPVATAMAPGLKSTVMIFRHDFWGWGLGSFSSPHVKADFSLSRTSGFLVQPGSVPGRWANALPMPIFLWWPWTDTGWLTEEGRCCMRWMPAEGALFSDAQVERGQGVQPLWESSAPNLAPLKCVELSKDTHHQARPSSWLNL